MATGVICPSPILQFFANDGTPLSGGSILVQVGGVNTAVYSDSGLTTALPNPIPLNSRGEPSTAAGTSSQIFMASGTTYTLTLSDAGANQIWQATTVIGSEPSGTVVTAVVAGTNITVDSSNPAQPVVSAPGVALLAGAAFTGDVSVTGTISSTGTGSFNTLG